MTRREAVYLLSQSGFANLYSWQFVDALCALGVLKLTPESAPTASASASTTAFDIGYKQGHGHGHDQGYREGYKLGRQHGVFDDVATRPQSA